LSPFAIPRSLFRVSQNEVRKIAERLSTSQILRDYELAFRQATGLPLTFRPDGALDPALQSSPHVNPFCKAVVSTDQGCKLCMEMQQRLTAPGTTDSRTDVCRAGLTDSAVPVRLGQQTLGHLQTGQVTLRKLTRGKFKELARWLDAGGAHADWHALEKLYFETPELSPQKYDAMIRLLEVFAQHLSVAAEQIATQQENAEPPIVQRARQFIDEHQGEDIGLGDVARAVHASTFHFCKMFKKATGMTFTHYLSLVRVTKAKKQLANPQLRISEIAYEVGFNSLTHFNRMFRKLAGESPTTYRDRVLGLTSPSGGR
jgi:AraC-like DNA-binding protein